MLSSSENKQNVPDIHSGSAERTLSADEMTPATAASSVFVPIGVFWDIENCGVPSAKSAVDVVNRIRERFFSKKREVEFMCVCDVRKQSKHVIQDLNKAQVTVIHIDGVSKNTSDDKIRQSLRRFGDDYRPPAVVVLISGDINFSPELSDLRYRKLLYVILIHPVNVSKTLIDSAHEYHSFQKLIEDLPYRQLTPMETESRCLIVTNLPLVNRKKVRGRLEFLAGNCRGKVLNIQDGMASMFFPNKQATDRAKQHLEGEYVDGHRISVKYSYECEKSLEFLSDCQSNYSNHYRQYDFNLQSQRQAEFCSYSGSPGMMGASSNNNRLSYNRVPYSNSHYLSDQGEFPVVSTACKDVRVDLFSSPQNSQCRYNGRGADFKMLESGVKIVDLDVPGDDNDDYNSTSDEDENDNDDNDNYNDIYNDNVVDDDEESDDDEEDGESGNGPQKVKYCADVMSDIDDVIVESVNESCSSSDETTDTLYKLNKLKKGTNCEKKSQNRVWNELEKKAKHSDSVQSDFYDTDFMAYSKNLQEMQSVTELGNQGIEDHFVKYQQKNTINKDSSVSQSDAYLSDDYSSLDKTLVAASQTSSAVTTVSQSALIVSSCGVKHQSITTTAIVSTVASAIQITNTSTRCATVTTASVTTSNCLYTDSAVVAVTKSYSTITAYRGPSSQGVAQIFDLSNNSNSIVTSSGNKFETKISKACDLNAGLSEGLKNLINIPTVSKEKILTKQEDKVSSALPPLNDPAIVTVLSQSSSLLKQNISEQQINKVFEGLKTDQNGPKLKEEKCEQSKNRPPSSMYQNLYEVPPNFRSRNRSSSGYFNGAHTDIRQMLSPADASIFPTPHHRGSSDYSEDGLRCIPVPRYSGEYVDVSSLATPPNQSHDMSHIYGGSGFRRTPGAHRPMSSGDGRNHLHPRPLFGQDFGSGMRWIGGRVLEEEEGVINEMEREDVRKLSPVIGCDQAKPDKQTQGVVLLVTNLDYNISMHEWKKILTNEFQQHVQLISVQVRMQLDNTSVAHVRVQTMENARYAINHFHRKKIGYKRIHVSLLEDSLPRNLDTLRCEVRELLLINPQIMLPEFLINFEYRYKYKVAVSDLYQITDIIDIEDLGNEGKIVRLKSSAGVGNGSQAVSPVNAEDCQPTIDTLCESLPNYEKWACPVHHKPRIDTLTQAAESPCYVIFVQLRAFSTNVHKLLQSHNGNVSVYSFPYCYSQEFKPLHTSTATCGVSVEHLIGCVPGVSLCENEDGVKCIQWEENKSQSAFSKLLRREESGVPASVTLALAHLSYDVCELLKMVPRCQLLLSEFTVMYRKLFQRTFRASDYGFSKLIDLLGNIRHACQVIGSGSKRMIMLSHTSQVKRFTNDLMLIFKTMSKKRIQLADFHSAYQKTFSVKFDITEYGLCYIDDMITELPESLIKVSGTGSSTVLHSKLKDQTKEELENVKFLTKEIIHMLRLKHEQSYSIKMNQFSSVYEQQYYRPLVITDYGFTDVDSLLESIPQVVKIVEWNADERFVCLSDVELLRVLEEDVTSLLRSSLASSEHQIPVPDFLTFFSQHHKRPLRLSDHSVNSVVDLVSKISAIARIDNINGRLVISLVDPSHVQSVVRNVLLILMDLSTDGSLPVAGLRSAYRQMFNALVDVSRLSSDEFNGYIQVLPSDKSRPQDSSGGGGVVVRLTALQMFARDARTLLLLHAGRLDLNQFELAYAQQFGVGLVAASYGYPTVLVLLQAIPHVVLLRGNGSHRMVLLSVHFQMKLSNIGSRSNSRRSNMIPSDYQQQSMDEYDSGLAVQGSVSSVTAYSPSNESNYSENRTDIEDLQKSCSLMTDLLGVSVPSTISSPDLMPWASPAVASTASAAQRELSSYLRNNDLLHLSPQEKRGLKTPLCRTPISDLLQLAAQLLPSSSSAASAAAQQLPSSRSAASAASSQSFYSTQYPQQSSTVNLGHRVKSDMNLGHRVKSEINAVNPSYSFSDNVTRDLGNLSLTTSYTEPILNQLSSLNSGHLASNLGTGHLTSSLGDLTDQASTRSLHSDHLSHVYQPFSQSCSAQDFLSMKSGHQQTNHPPGLVSKVNDGRITSTLSPALHESTDSNLFFCDAGNNKNEQKFSTLHQPSGSLAGSGYEFKPFSNASATDGAYWSDGRPNKYESSGKIPAHSADTSSDIVKSLENEVHKQGESHHRDVVMTSCEDLERSSVSSAPSGESTRQSVSSNSSMSQTPGGRTRRSRLAARFSDVSN